MSAFNRLAFALAYARNGAKAFPCNFILPNGECSCGTADCHEDPHGRGKHPLHRRWQAEATADHRKLVQLWAAAPDANIGIACGRGSNLTVVDVDGIEGLDQLREFERKHGALPDTPRCITGSKSLHLLFEYTPGLTNAVRWAPGCDIRTEGGLIIGAGSANAAGEYMFEAGYSISDLPRAKMPDWLVAEIKAGQGAKHNGAGGKHNGNSNGADDGADILKGQRDDTIFKLACKLRWAGLSIDEVLAKVHKVNATRCKPSLPDRQVVAKVEQAFKYKNREEAEAQEPEAEEEARPLTQEIPEPEEYPTEALGPILGPAARGICGLAQAPAAIGAQSVLGVAALVVQAHSDIELPHGDGLQTRPLSLYFALIALSGDRKTTCDNYALEPVIAYQQRLLTEYKDQYKEYLKLKAIWTRKHAEAVKKANAYEELTQLGDEPEPPLKPVIISGDPTLEGLVKLLAEGCGNSGVFSSEGGMFLNGFAMSEENRVKTCAGLSKLWDGGFIDRVRGGDGSSMIFGRRVSIHLQMQPRVAAGMFDHKDLKDQGILSRFLGSWVTSIAGKRLWREPSAADIEALTAYKQQARKILDVPYPIVEGTRNQLNPGVLRLSPEALKLWKGFYDEIEKQLTPGGPLDDVRPLANKLLELAARLAGVMTKFGDLTAREVSKGTMADGITLAQYYLGEALRIVRISKIDEELARAQRVLTWLQEEWDEANVSLPDLYQYGPERNMKSSREVARGLENHGWLVPLDEPVEIKGKMRREAWRIRGQKIRGQKGVV